MVCAAGQVYCGSFRKGSGPDGWAGPVWCVVSGCVWRLLERAVVVFNGDRGWG